MEINLIYSNNGEMVVNKEQMITTITFLIFLLVLVSISSISKNKRIECLEQQFDTAIAQSGTNFHTAIFPPDSVYYISFGGDTIWYVKSEMFYKDLGDSVLILKKGDYRFYI
jgi:hypothetical protein